MRIDLHADRDLIIAALTEYFIQHGIPLEEAECETVNLLDADGIQIEENAFSLELSYTKELPTTQKAIG